MTLSIETVRKAWARAATFPPNKEQVYFEHARVQEFDRHRDKCVLEYGCGGGSDAMSYLRRGCTVWYVDVVPENVDMARRRIEQARLNRKAYGLTINDSAQIPITARFFDIVNAHGVLHHIPNPGPVLREFHRLLRDDGLLYVMLYTEFLFKRFAGEIALLQHEAHVSVEEAFSWCTDGRGTPYATWYSEERGGKLLESHGFKLVDVSLYQSDDFRTFKAVKA